MKQLKSKEEMIGKTINKSLTGDDSFIITFDDDSYIIFKIGGYYGSTFALKDNLDSVSMEMKHKAGIVSQEEYQIYLDEYKEY